MGAEPWEYFVPYRPDIAAALEDLRQQEFAAGRYYKGRRGTAAASIDEAIENGDATGTQSILDISGVADEPLVPDPDDPEEFPENAPFGMVVPVSAEQLVETYGTETPTRADIEKAGGFPEWVNRGFGVYVIAYDDAGRPSEIYFGGLSYD